MIDGKYTDYATKVLNGDIIACKYIKLACKRYLSFLERDDIEFKPNKVDKVVKFMSNLHHFTGKHNGKPFILSPFQFWIICNIYGFYWKDRNERVCKNVYLELARKNGKSFFAAAMALYNMIADGENNAECELVANSRKQAGIVFQMCKNLVDELDPKHKFFKSYRDNIKFDTTKSFLQVLSADVNNNDGWNSSCYVVDEYHSAPNSLMYDVMKSSQAMRENPLAIVITTAGFNLFSPCYQMRKTCIEILNNVKEDDTQFSAIYTLDEEDDWKDESTWIKANPNLNITVKPSYLREQVQQAVNNTTMEVSVRTKNFNCWLSTSDVWINNDLLLKCSKKIDLKDFNGNFGYIGVDLAAVSDLTAVSIMIPIDDKYYFKTFYYLPSSTLYDNSNSELYKKWKREGLINITEGNVTDYSYIINDLHKISDNILIQKIAYDSWNSTQWAIDCTEQGFPLSPFSQSIGNFNKPCKELERLIKSGKVIIDDNEITRFCFQNVILKYDWNENCKPTKAENQNKIDGVISMIESLGTYLEEPQFDNEITVV